MKNFKPMNIFEFLDIQHKENAISKFIVSVLNYDKEYLKSFLMQLELDNKIDYQKCKAYTERHLKSRNKKKSYGRADIWFGYKKEGFFKRIIIENKIFAGDQYKQLSRYRNYLDEKDAEREGYLFYLTIQGKTAPTTSTKTKDGGDLSEGNPESSYKALSYEKHILPWLKQIENSSRNMKLRFLINDLRTVIEELSVPLKDFEEGKALNEISEQHIVEFRSLCELEFWRELERIILEKYPKACISSRRKYNFDKITKSQNGKKHGRSYGIVFDNKRIQVLKEHKPFKIKFSEGKFAEHENKWIEAKGDPKIKEFDVDKLSSQNNAREYAEKIANLFLDN